MSRRAFTLIELLVVIAIIAILAAVLFPVFSRAREKARQSTCASNEKQIGIAFLQYVQDFDETSPPICQGICNINRDASDLYWQDIIYSYVKSTGVYTCPSDASTTPTYVTAMSYTTGAPDTTHWGSYIANDVCDNANQTRTAGCTPPFSFQSGGAVTTIAMMAAPSSTVLVSETTTTMTNNLKPNLWPFAFQPALADALTVDTTDLPYPVLDDAVHANLWGLISARHTNMANVLFCDGHVKAMSLSGLMTAGTTNIPTYFTCQADPS